MTIAAADCFVQRRGVWPVFRVDGNENEPCVCGTGPLMHHAVWLIAALAVVAHAFQLAPRIKVLWRSNSWLSRLSLQKSTAGKISEDSLMFVTSYSALNMTREALLTSPRLFSSPPISLRLALEA